MERRSHFTEVSDAQGGFQAQFFSFEDPLTPWLVHYFPFQFVHIPFVEAIKLHSTVQIDYHSTSVFLAFKKLMKQNYTFLFVNFKSGKKLFAKENISPVKAN